MANIFSKITGYFSNKNTERKSNNAVKELGLNENVNSGDTINNIDIKRLVSVNNGNSLSNIMSSPEIESEFWGNEKTKAYLYDDMLTRVKDNKIELDEFIDECNLRYSIFFHYYSGMILLDREWIIESNEQWAFEVSGLLNEAKETLTNFSEGSDEYKKQELLVNKYEELYSYCSELFDFLNNARNRKNSYDIIKMIIITDFYLPLNDINECDTNTFDEEAYKEKLKKLKKDFKLNVVKRTWKNDTELNDLKEQRLKYELKCVSLKEYVEKKYKGNKDKEKLIRLYDYYYEYIVEIGNLLNN